ncbi:MAG: M14 family metallopeptidase [Ignavibacteriaceae bacterium]
MKKKVGIPKEWLTQFENSGMLESPDYETTIKYFEQFEKTTPFLKIKNIGLTPEGREIKVIIVAKNQVFVPLEAKKTGKTIVLIQNGIHPGEIEGKDACMIMLREILITKEKEHLLDNLILLIIPVLNIDGHERLSAFNRPNQHGPKQMGWRTNALNLNLNRDYMKAESPEIKAFLKLFYEWTPDFVIDNHSTNGADYQYHVTYGIETKQNMDENLSSWIKEKYLPYLTANVEKDGFLTAPYIEFKNGSIESGIKDWSAPPRLSHGYCAAQNRICLLVETHSLKPFDNRVFSTLSMMTHTLDFLNSNHAELILYNLTAEKIIIKKYINKKQPFPLILSGTEKSKSFNFKAFEWKDEQSDITGSTVRRYTDKPAEIVIPLYNDVEVKKEVRLPFAYFVPQQFTYIIDTIRNHHIKYFRFRIDTTKKVERYRFKNVFFAPYPYEGRQLVKFDCELFEDEIFIPKGTIWVPVNQRQIKIIVNLLEPEAPDSFVNWGFFNAFFERKEYAEPYVMEPYAKMMIENDPKLKEEFIKLLNDDESFRNNPSERLDYFYRRSPFFDKYENIYPVYRVMERIEDRVGE